MEIKTTKSLSQTLIPSLAMQQAFFVLQLPQVELAEWIHLQIEQNPLLHIQETKGPIRQILEEEELDFNIRNFEILNHLDDSFKTAIFPEDQDRLTSQEEILSNSISLYDHLKEQAQEMFSGKDLKEAEKIIASLDHLGFLGTTAVNEDILKIVQTFDPPGIAARDLRESLLLQLKYKGEENSLLYTIISLHFQDLLHNRFLDLEKKLELPAHTLKKRIRKKLFSLNFQPAAKFTRDYTQALIPDIYVYKIGHEWHIEIDESFLPSFNLIHFDNNATDKSYIKSHITQGKWLLHIIRRRHTTLKTISSYLLKHQQAFFNGDLHQLIPLNMQQAAQEIGLHASTIARATSHKYISTPHGIFALRNFFSHALKTSHHKPVSHHTVKQLLLNLIKQENKQMPLSDEQIVEIFLTKGINCARRTITKYRKHLHIPSSLKRRE